MKKWFATGSLYFLLLHPGIELHALSPQMALAIPFVERVVKNGTIESVIAEHGWVFLFFRVTPRSQYEIERLADRVERTLGTNPETLEGTFYAGAFIDEYVNEKHQFALMWIAHSISPPSSVPGALD